MATGEDPAGERAEARGLPRLGEACEDYIKSGHGCLRWEDVNLDVGLFRVEETKTGVPLELSLTRQLGEILARRRAEGNAMPEDLHGWVFPSRSSVSGHVEELQTHYEAIGREGGANLLVQNGTGDKGGVTGICAGTGRSTRCSLAPLREEGSLPGGNIPAADTVRDFLGTRSAGRGGYAEGPSGGSASGRQRSHPCSCGGCRPKQSLSITATLVDRALSQW